MTTQNSSSLIDSVYKSRKIILELMKKQGYKIKYPFFYSEKGRAKNGFILNIKINKEM